MTPPIVKPLPDKVLFKMNQDRLQGFIHVLSRLIELYQQPETEDDKITLVLLERTRVRLRQSALRNQLHFRVFLPIENCLAWYKALCECGGVFDGTWLKTYYIAVMMHLDPIVK